ncbi:MAG: hypothetical protein JWM02_3511 [Frankiales bacterium]|nr:hypothetical protein [Frankiales bacterium]
MKRSQARLNPGALDVARADLEVAQQAVSDGRTAAHEAKAALSTIEARAVTVDGAVTVPEMVEAETAVRLTELRLAALEEAHAAAMQLYNRVVADDAADAYWEWELDAVHLILERVADARRALAALVETLNGCKAVQGLHQMVLREHAGHAANARIRASSSGNYVFVDGRDLAPVTSREIIFRVAGEAMNALADREGAGVADSMFGFSVDTIPPIGGGR